MKIELIERIRSDPESFFKRGATFLEIADVQNQLEVTFPLSYQEFLRHFNGGEFRFARMHRITPEGAGFFDLVEMFEQDASISSFRTHQLLPFGDDYGGNYYCFDLTQRSADNECPVVLWDHEVSDNEGPFPEAVSLKELIEKGLQEEE